MPAGLIAHELLAWATDEELEDYVEWLAAEADVEDLDRDAWGLQDRQQAAEDALGNLDGEMSHELLYGGAAGPGKTEFLLWHAFHQCVQYPGLKVLMLRRTYTELRRSLVIRSLERFDRSLARYTITENTWKFGNGSTIEFGYCEADQDVYQYQSAEYDIVLWDELTQWKSPFPYLYLFSRVRSRISTIVRGFVPHVVAATNPGGVGGAWVKARFVDTGPPEVRSVHEIELGDDVAYGTRIFIPGKLADNRYINRKQYTAGLAHLPEQQRDALLDGSWDTIEGQYFTEWHRHLHVVKPFPIPQWWTRLRCIDYGHFAPWACLWLAFDQDGNAVLYREAYETQLTPRQQCEMIGASQMPGEKFVYTVADPSMWAKTGVGVPIAQQYANNGIPLRQAMNARVSGWARVREYLIARAPVLDEHGEKVLDADGIPLEFPGLRVFSTCANFIRTFPMLVHDNVNPEDLDTDGEDHAADALRYGLMSRPPLGRKPVSDEPNTPQGRMARARRERELERQGKRSVDHPDLGRI
jgi:hypothetical protein